MRNAFDHRGDAGPEVRITRNRRAIRVFGVPQLRVGFFNLQITDPPETQQDVALLHPCDRNDSVTRSRLAPAALSGDGSRSPVIPFPAAILPHAVFFLHRRRAKARLARSPGRSFPSPPRAVVRDRTCVRQLLYTLLPLRLVVADFYRCDGGGGNQRRNAGGINVRPAQIQQRIAKRLRSTHRPAHTSERFGQRHHRNIDDFLKPALRGVSRAVGAEGTGAVCFVEQ